METLKEPDIIPDFCDELFDFQNKYGHLGYCGDDAIPSYTTIDDKTYRLPKAATREKLEELYKKSLRDNKDYVLEYVKQ